VSDCPRQENGYTALIIEDDPAIALLLEALVEEHGYGVTICPDAESGWAHFEKNQVHLLLVDWMLPGMNGVDFCEKIKATDRGKYLTILMSSVKSDPEDMAKAVNAGVNFFMVKPIKKEILDVWLSAASKHIDDCLKREADDLAFIFQKQALEDYNEQLEEAIGRANQMAVDAERAYIEVNQIFKTVAGGILFIDTDFNLIRCNDSFLEMANASWEEAQSCKCYDVFRSSLCDTENCPLQRIKKNPRRIEGEIERAKGDGESSFYHLITTPFKGLDGDLIGIVEHITDVTARVKAERALIESERRYKELSIIDELTQLYNKRYFNNELPLEVERARRYQHPLSLLLMDIDNFKHHNDTYGHADGDKVLERLGRVVVSALRVNDVPCRYGGEEFTVILPDTCGENAMVVAERIRENFAAEIFCPNPEEEVRKTVSIGVTQYIPGEEEESFLARADGNMYQAKQSGKNRSVLK